jgi:hypothetical protein
MTAFSSLNQQLYLIAVCCFFVGFRSVCHLSIAYICCLKKLFFSRNQFLFLLFLKRCLRSFLSIFHDAVLVATKFVSCHVYTLSNFNTTNNFGQWWVVVWESKQFLLDSIFLVCKRGAMDFALLLLFLLTLEKACILC